MDLKHAIIAVMDRDTLKAAVDALEMDGVDRRSAEDMADRLSRAHRATPDFLLESLHEPQVKEVCEQFGVSSAGRRSSLVRRLLRRQTTAAKSHAKARTGCCSRNCPVNPEAARTFFQLGT